MINTSFEKCIEYMKLKHGNQKRKQGTPYYNHPLAVAKMLDEKGFNEDYQVVGLFHDLLEDTDATYDEIIRLANLQVLESVELLTKSNGYVMNEYIDKIRQNDMAKMVKLADRIHNLSDSKYNTVEFKIKYIKETQEWYIDLAKDTVFENDMKDALEDVINQVKEEN